MKVQFMYKKVHSSTEKKLCSVVDWAEMTSVSNRLQFAVAFINCTGTFHELPFGY